MLQLEGSSGCVDRGCELEVAVRTAYRAAHAAVAAHLAYEIPGQHLWSSAIWACGRARGRGGWATMVDSCHFIVSSTDLI